MGQRKGDLQPTCTTSGGKTYTCTDCGFEKIKSIDAKGHNYGEEWQHDGAHHWHIINRNVFGFHHLIACVKHNIQMIIVQVNCIDKDVDYRPLFIDIICGKLEHIIQKRRYLGFAYRNIYIARLLCALHKEKHPKDYLFPDRKPIEKLAQRNADGSFSDMYKIERDIIWVFNADNTNNFSVGPFTYDIVGFEDDGDDTEEEFFAREGN